jgi:hypothetical protein
VWNYNSSWRSTCPSLCSGASVGCLYAKETFNRQLIESIRANSFLPNQLEIENHGHVKAEHKSYGNELAVSVAEHGYIFKYSEKELNDLVLNFGSDSEV